MQLNVTLGTNAAPLLLHACCGDTATSESTFPSVPFRLTALPATIGALKSLQQLQLSFNRLRELPSSIGRCSGLTSVSIARNSLGQLPSSFSCLQKLQWLDVSGNLLRSVVGVVGQLEALRQLEVHGNCIGAEEERQLTGRCFQQMGTGSGRKT
jgi:hypothetical protein